MFSYAGKEMILSNDEHERIELKKQFLRMLVRMELDEAT